MTILRTRGSADTTLQRQVARLLPTCLFLAASTSGGALVAAGRSQAGATAAVLPLLVLVVPV